jgi:hypothetical protein
MEPKAIVSLNDGLYSTTIILCDCRTSEAKKKNKMKKGKYSLPKKTKLVYIRHSSIKNNSVVKIIFLTSSAVSLPFPNTDGTAKVMKKRLFIRCRSRDRF